MKTFNYKKVRKEQSETNQLAEYQSFELLDLNQAAEYLKLKPSYMYSLIHQKRIPYYKPNGKRVYFNKAELNKWIIKSKIKSIDELAEEYNKQKEKEVK